MQLGIFAKTSPRAACSVTLNAITSHRLRCIQFNFSSVGLSTLPESIAPELIAQIRRECEQREVSIAGVSGTFNMIHPDERHRSEHLSRLAVLARASQELACELITLCTGTRDATDMWRAHP